MSSDRPKDQIIEKIRQAKDQQKLMLTRQPVRQLWRGIFNAKLIKRDQAK